MVTNPAAYDPSALVEEGFAEFIRRYIGNPAWAEQNAARSSLGISSVTHDSPAPMLK
jgi:hypothetical protein